MGVGQYANIVSEAAARTGVPESIIRSVLQSESSGDPNALSKKGAAGLMQLMPGTAKELGVVNVNDPAENIHAGAKYLAKMFKETGNWQDALAAYNWGIGNVKKYGAAAAPSETKAYVPKVFGLAGGEAVANSRPAWNPKAVDNTDGLDPAYSMAMTEREAGTEAPYMLADERELLHALGLIGQHPGDVV